MTKPSRGERIRYVFDNFMARGTIALILGLFVVAAIGVILVTVVVAVFFRNEAPLSDLLWNSLMRTLDPGTMGGDEGSFGFLLGMLAVTLFGIFIISALIGIINTGLEGKLAQLRKGRSRVVESGHTVILGWSQEVFTVVSELVVANAEPPTKHDRHPGRPGQGRDGRRDPDPRAGPRPDVDRLPLGRSDGHRRPRHRAARDVAIDRHPLARDRRP